MSAESEAASKAARRVRRGTQATVQANRRAAVANRAPGVRRGAAINQFNAAASGNTGNLFGRGSRANRRALRARNAPLPAIPGSAPTGAGLPGGLLRAASNLAPSRPRGAGRGAARRRRAQVLAAPAGGATGQRR